MRYRGADNSLARSTSRCIFFDGENISFDVSLVIQSENISFDVSLVIQGVTGGKDQTSGECSLC